MEWQPALETGQAQIDEEHRALVAALNRLHDTVDGGGDREEVERTLAFLRDYTVTHFAAEEELMLRHRYPGASAHFAAHADLVLRLSDLLAEHRTSRAGAEAATLEGLMAFLEAWLVEHILRQDQDLGAFLKNCGALV
jgi:hemerythrin-like metal-binding protein